MKTETNVATGRSYDRKVVKVDGNKLIATCEDGDEHHYTIEKDAKIVRDGKESKLSELTKGSTIRMTMSKDDKNKVIAIESGTHIPALVKV